MMNGPPEIYLLEILNFPPLIITHKTEKVKRFFQKNMLVSVFFATFLWKSYKIFTITGKSSEFHHANEKKTVNAKKFRRLF